MVRVRFKVKVREALVILDEASCCGPVRTVQLVWCFYGPIVNTAAVSLNLLIG